MKDGFLRLSDDELKRSRNELREALASTAPGALDEERARERAAMHPR